MASPSSHVPRKSAKLFSHKLLKNDNVYELTLNEIRYVGSTYFAHHKDYWYSPMYIISCVYTLKNEKIECCFTVKLWIPPLVELFITVIKYLTIVLKFLKRKEENVNRVQIIWTCFQITL